NCGPAGKASGGGRCGRGPERLICALSVIWCKTLPLSGKEVRVAGGSGEPVGSARLELVSGVALLRGEDAGLEAMLEGWAKQQVGGRGLSPKTIGRRQAVVRQFLDHAGEYPWSWTAAHLDDWSADLAGMAGKAKSAVRNYHDAIRSFESYLIA